MRSIRTSDTRAIVLVVGLAMLSLCGYWTFMPGKMYDFRAFYCAGQSTALRADPYREQPLHDCERRSTTVGVSRDPADTTVPAPFPPFVLALFACFGVLPFAAAVVLWCLLSIAALAATIVLVRRTTAVPLAAIAIVVALPALVTAVPLGQVAPFVELGIALCGYGVVRERRAALAAGAILTTLAPAVAVALWAALAIGARFARVPLALAAAGLAALTAIVVPTATTLEFVRTILPAHARANVAEQTQYSATHFAWALGAAPARALAIGEGWYVVAVLVGIVVALRLKRTLPVALAFVPPAFAVFGGVHVHYHQLLFGVPAFLMIAGLPNATTSMRAAIFLVAVPWSALAGYPPFALALAVLGTTYARVFHCGTIAARLGIGAGIALLAAFAVAVLALGTAPENTAAFIVHVPGNPIAEDAWGAYIARRNPAPNVLMLALQLPTVVAFTYCLAVLTISAFLQTPKTTEAFRPR